MTTFIAQGEDVRGVICESLELGYSNGGPQVSTVLNPRWRSCRKLILAATLRRLRQPVRVKLPVTCAACSFSFSFLSSSPLLQPSRDWSKFKL